MSPLTLFNPIYQQRPWGGRTIESALGRTIPSGPIGESWEIVDREEAQSQVASGPHTGKTLRMLLNENPAYWMGPHWPRSTRFPILVKWLDATERLSLQVHPPAVLAEKLNGEPKTECWYMAKTTPAAHIFMGLKIKTTPEEFAKAAKSDTIEELLQQLPTHPDTMAFIPSGRLHAIDAGNLILEIQQNSDTTYRVFDWGRLDASGKSRALHLEQALQCIDFADINPNLLPPTTFSQERVQCPYFRVHQYRLKKGEKIKFLANQQPRIFSFIEGHIAINGMAVPLNQGTNGLLPYAESIEIEALSSLTNLLVTDSFNAL